MTSDKNTINFRFFRFTSAIGRPERVSDPELVRANLYRAVCVRRGGPNGS